MLINNEEGNRTVKAWSYATNILIYFSYMVLLTFIFLSYYDKDASVNREHVVNYEYKKHIPKDYRKIIIYSCLIGNYDKVATFKRQKGYDYILFTDQKIENTNWTLYPIPKEVLKLKVSKVKKQRYMKIHPHKFFKNYDLSVYIDANYIIKGDMDDFLENTLNPIDIIYICHLQFGRGLHKAIQTAIDQKLDKKSILMETMRRYNESKILGKQGIVNAGLIIRKHHEKECIKLMENGGKK